MEFKSQSIPCYIVFLVLLSSACCCHVFKQARSRTRPWLFYDIKNVAVKMHMNVDVEKASNSVKQASKLVSKWASSQGK